MKASSRWVNSGSPTHSTDQANRSAPTASAESETTDVSEMFPSPAAASVRAATAHERADGTVVERFRSQRGGALVLCSGVGGEHERLRQPQPVGFTRRQPGLEGLDGGARVALPHADASDQPVTERRPAGLHYGEPFLDRNIQIAKPQAGDAAQVADHGIVGAVFNGVVEPHPGALVQTGLDVEHR